MKPLSRSLVIVASIAALSSGCALKPVQVTGKEVNGGQSETSFAMSRFGDVDSFCHARSRLCTKRPDDKYHVQ